MRGNPIRNSCTLSPSLGSGQTRFCVILMIFATSIFYLQWDLLEHFVTPSGLHDPLQKGSYVQTICPE